MELAKRDHYRERLLAERAQMVNEMNRISESIPEEVRPPGEHEIAPSEGVDVEIALATGKGARLSEIDAALERIKEGTFGKCCDCGRETSAARLDAVPSAMYCARCEKKHSGH